VSVAMEEGLRLAIRVGGCMLGEGTITEILA